MKAIVLENRDGFSVLLRDDGEIVKLRMQAQVGETVELSAEPIPLRSAKSPWLRTAVAASLALVIAGGSYAYVSVPASAFVSLDAGESSVELAVNRLGRIVSVRPKNKASIALSDELAENVRGNQVDDGIRKTVQCLQKDGALSEENGCLIAGVTSNAPTSESAITQIVEEVTTSDGEDPVELYTITVTEEERQEAEANDQSAGSYAFNRRKMRRMKRRKERMEQRKQEAEAAAQLQTTETEKTVESEQPVEAAQPAEDKEAAEQTTAAEIAAPAAVTTPPAEAEQPSVSQQTEEISEQQTSETEEYASDVPEFTEEKQERKEAKKEERRRRRKQRRKERRKQQRQARREAEAAAEEIPETDLEESTENET